MVTNPDGRKPLRQRVADRKRGIKEVKYTSDRTKRLLKYLKIFLTTTQYLGLILLLLSLGDIVRSEYKVENWNLIMTYSFMFLIGRAGLTILTSMGLFK